MKHAFLVKNGKFENIVLCHYKLEKSWHILIYNNEQHHNYGTVHFAPVITTSSWATNSRKKWPRNAILEHFYVIFWKRGRNDRDSRFMAKNWKMTQKGMFHQLFCRCNPPPLLALNIRVKSFEQHFLTLTFGGKCFNDHWNIMLDSKIRTGTLSIVSFFTTKTKTNFWGLKPQPN